MSIEDAARTAVAAREQERTRQAEAAAASAAAAEKQPDEQVKTAIEQWAAALGFSSIEITAYRNGFWDDKGASGVTVLAAFTADRFKFVARQIQRQPLEVFLRYPKAQPREYESKNGRPFQEMLIPGNARETIELVYRIEELADLGAALKLH